MNYCDCFFPLYNEQGRETKWYLTLLVHKKRNVREQQRRTITEKIRQSRFLLTHFDLLDFETDFLFVFQPVFYFGMKMCTCTSSSNFIIFASFRLLWFIWVQQPLSFVLCGCCPSFRLQPNWRVHSGYVSMWQMISLCGEFILQIRNNSLSRTTLSVSNHTCMLAFA